MNQRLFLSLACALLFVLAAVPVLAADVTCPSSCACLLPAEAGKLGSSGLCDGRQTVCGYDSLQTMKYCYAKPNAATTVPPVQVKTTGTMTPLTTTVPPVTPQPCPSGCACLSPAEGGKRGLLSCGPAAALCGYGPQQERLSCYVLPAPATTPVTVIVTGVRISTTAVPVRPVISTLPAAVRAVTTAPVPAATTAPPLPARKTPVTLPPTIAPAGTAPAGDILSAIAAFLGSLFSPPAASTPSRPVSCNGTLTDLMQDDRNCGSCGTDCGNGQCVMGRCTEETPVIGRPCSLQEVLCNGACQNIMFNETNCGSCGNSCSAGEGCCSGSCVNLSQNENCGACGNECHFWDSSCRNGTCVCYGAGETRCGTGYCYDLQSSEENCGSCGHACGGEETCCSGTCSDLAGDPANCGSCGYACPSYRNTCHEGACVNLSYGESTCGSLDTECAWNEACCAGQCLDLYTDEGNCGECGEACAAGLRCCDGTCRDLDAEEENCGTCGRACGYGEACCGGTCTYLSSDSNCGSCGRSCSWYETCMSWDCRSYWDIFWDTIF